MIETKPDSKYVVCLPSRVCATALVSAIDETWTDDKVMSFLKLVDDDPNSVDDEWAREADYLVRAAACETARCVARRCDLRVKVEPTKYVAALVADVREGGVVMALGRGPGGENCAWRTAERLNRGETVPADWGHADEPIATEWCVAKTEDLVLDCKVGSASPRPLQSRELRAIVNTVNYDVLVELGPIVNDRSGHIRYRETLAVRIDEALRERITWTSVHVGRIVTRPDSRADVYLRCGAKYTHFTVSMNHTEAALHARGPAAPASERQHAKSANFSDAIRPSPPTVPLYDGLTAKQCFERYERAMQSEMRYKVSTASTSPTLASGPGKRYYVFDDGTSYLTDRQLDAALALRTHYLSAKVAASAAADAARAPSVRVQGDWVDDEECL